MTKLQWQNTKDTIKGMLILWILILISVLTLNACLPVNRVVETADGDRLGPLLRYTDPEYEIVCYTLQAIGSAPAISCVKR